MKNLEIGDVFQKNSKKYVLFNKTFEEWYNTGGMGELTYSYVLLEDLLAYGDCEDTEALDLRIIKEKGNSFKENDIKVLEDEAPYELKTREVTLYSIRRKKMTTKIVWE